MGRGKKKRARPGFSQRDYLSGDGFQTPAWGPAMWHMIHTCSFNYPVEPSKQQKKDYLRWMLSLGKVLPCRYCRDNYPKNLSAGGLSNATFASRASFSRFCFDLHERVNSMLGKDSGLTFAEVRDRYEMLRARCLTEAQKKRQLATAKKLSCAEAVYDGSKARLCLRVVPRDSDAPGFHIDRRCVPKS